jgi:hypothetical protein
VTSAVAASYFGVTGTVIGAAFGSVVSSVAAALYAQSLTHAGRRIRTVVVTPVGARGGTGTADPSDPTAVPGGLTGVREPIVNETVLLPNGQERPPSGAPSGSNGPGAGWSPGAGPAAGRRPRRYLRPAIAIGGFAFVASIGAISATEFLVGHPVARADLDGTSVGSLLGGNATKAAEPEPMPDGDVPSPSDSTSPSSPSPSDSTSPSESVSEQATSSPDATGDDGDGAASPTDPAASSPAGDGAGAPSTTGSAAPDVGAGSPAPAG